MQASCWLASCSTSQLLQIKRHSYFLPLGFHYNQNSPNSTVFFFKFFFCFSVSEKFMGLFFFLFNCA